MAHADDAFAVAQRFGQRPAQDNTDILNSVMFVNVQVAFGSHLQIKAGMASQGMQHVIEKANPGANLGLTGAIQIQGDFNFRFARFTGNGGNAR
jgi:hypothetical protein